jgi:tetratricopeptide (TPR) repeat protein
MERTKYRLILILLLLQGFLQIKAGFRSEIYYAYIHNRMDIWKDAIDRLNSVEAKTDELILELVNYQYGYIGYCIGYKKRDDAKKYLELAERNIKVLAENKFSPSLINAYKCAFYGFRIGLNKLSAPINGLKSIEHARSALALDKENYFAYIQYGNIQFYMPAAFGGSKKEGIEYFLKAKEILEKNPRDLTENWNYLSLLLIIGHSYSYINELNSAKSMYEDILRLEPDFLFVKNELYPRLLKKMEN